MSPPRSQVQARAAASAGPATWWVQTSRSQLLWIRWRRAWSEFLVVPLAAVSAFVVLGVVATLADRARPAWLGPLRHAISSNAASSVLTAEAAAIVTVTAITFSVLLLAVQQAANALTPVVSDQFLRRRPNQAYFGFYAGLATYSFLVLAFAPSNASICAGLELLLCAVAFVMLVLLIYGTVDQMRPATVAHAIHDLARGAREHQLPLIARCRSTSQTPGVSSIAVLTASNGYLVDVSVSKLASATAGISEGGEIEFEAVLGAYLAHGDRLAVVRSDSAEERLRLARAVGRAVTLDRFRDLDADPGYGIDQLANIVWSSSSSAQQNPEAALVAIEALRDLLVRWTVQTLPDAKSLGGPLPVVYRPHDTQRILDRLVALLPVSVESAQHHTCAAVLNALALNLTRIAPEARRRVVERLDRVLAAPGAHVLSFEMSEALESLGAALRATGYHHMALEVEQLLDGQADRRPRGRHADHRQ